MNVGFKSTPFPENIYWIIAEFLPNQLCVECGSLAYDCDCWKYHIYFQSPYVDIYELGLWCQKCQEGSDVYCQCHIVWDKTHCRVCNTKLNKITDKYCSYLCAYLNTQ